MKWRPTPGEDNREVEKTWRNVKEEKTHKSLT